MTARRFCILTTFYPAVRLRRQRHRCPASRAGARAARPRGHRHSRCGCLRVALHPGPLPADAPPDPEGVRVVPLVASRRTSSAPTSGTRWPSSIACSVSARRWWSADAARS